MLTTVGVCLPLAHALYVASAWAQKAWLADSAAYYREGVVGFSGVGCALSVVAAHTERARASAAFPPGLMPVAQVALSHVLMPDASVRGHVCGLAAGYTYTMLAPRATRLLRHARNRCRWQWRCASPAARRLIAAAAATAAAAALHLALAGNGGGRSGGRRSGGARPALAYR